MNKKGLAIVKSILDDIKTNDNLDEASSTLNNRVTVELLLLAGCPEIFIQAMKETLDLSYTERRYCCDQILTKLKQIS